MRRVININDDWKFIKQDKEQPIDKDYNDEKWEILNLPHTWNAIDGANGCDFYKGTCWYRKVFSVDALSVGKKVFIEFEGSNSITDVYVNGKLLGQHRGGYSTFRFDITDAVEYGSKNLLAVKVDNTVVDDVYPQMADFTFYGGIYRDVNIIIADKVHFDLMDYGSKGIYIVQDEVTEEKASLAIKSRLVNANEEEKKVKLWADIYDSEGKVVTYVAKEVIIPSGETKEVDMPVIIEKAILWNGRKNPYLYEVKVSITSYNDRIDELSIPFGVRYFKVDAEKGFYLNGEHLALKGVSRHQDRKDMGWAITEADQIEDMELIKEIGATSIRLAHYQHNQIFYDLCDREGMVVWAEIPFISTMSKEELEGINAKQQMTELIRQNFNHPSIMFWGIQNEIQIGGERSEVRKLVKELNELTKKEDPTRLSTMANVAFVDENDEYNYITDILGYNQYYGWYSGKAEDFSEWIDNYHKVNPSVALCISEYGAEGIVQYHSSNPEVKDYTEEYHALLHEKVWNIFKDKSFLWGTYVWNMFDFGANIRDEGGVKGRNNKGLVTYDRKIKKDAFYMYKSHWSDEKFVHITSKRFLDRIEDKITVKVYSNCSIVTLYVNGEELETKVNDDKVFIFEDVILKDGINVLKAVAQCDDIRLEDSALFNKVNEKNTSYEAPVDDKGKSAENWFQMPELNDVEVEAIEISDEVYSTRCTFGELIKNEEAKAVLRKYLGKLDEHPSFAMTMGMTIDKISALAKEIYNEKMMYVLNRDLSKIKKS
ncbi:beta galactosidase jelly roll domain-containing protein [Clostridium sp. YIM B02505]|uniref:Beta galactosidase jelly roll domain-containing protein n=1 Tax=Clostridium yunnanense TaxID=2800325 RepID=A0ABS1ESC7_9CLOT|nr:glycoside hydrolase family 2 TIM barrel-domain containing protein [Clostridium yunnanense]MBK1812289.1 beta galactosidase jelly roll domain-containing protein [Clostridium yunnanense]